MEKKRKDTINSDRKSLSKNKIRGEEKREMYIHYVPDACTMKIETKMKSNE
jgi:hypothetical protein